MGCSRLDAGKKLPAGRSSSAYVVRATKNVRPTLLALLGTLHADTEGSDDASGSTPSLLNLLDAL